MEQESRPGIGNRDLEGKSLPQDGGDDFGANIEAVVGDHLHGTEATTAKQQFPIRNRDAFRRKRPLGLGRRFRGNRCRGLRSRWRFASGTGYMGHRYSGLRNAERGREHRPSDRTGRPRSMRRRRETRLRRASGFPRRRGVGCPLPWPRSGPAWSRAERLYGAGHGCGS
jgi:hypothetical protein